MSASIKERLKELVDKKDAIEKEIKELYEVLDSQQGVGMDGALIDSDGYPRNDIDIYSVRTARHNIICLQNDHKELMKQIEKGLHALHGLEKVNQVAETGKKPTEKVDRKPFAKIDIVTPESPASIGGLEVGDQVIKFGSVTVENFHSLQNIGQVVQHSQGKPVSLTVIRNGEVIHLAVKPQTWSGRGLLGCNIVPL
ncbi:26S proteasome non-ATPase regulatory subunit 9-like [Saccoglossus kowalevskii]|uniref:26S proteasome non-ATPase regulatory subunit 9 n=1 Tax=Saccoglossus kowalevskii TaxID=10224 RepID=A0ABM0GNA3_SACKO|nr:PREDICTED: 26S proteasome non-ATPase regulatory subunit 9-like [Saccoglossus kowalevskii]